MPINDKRDPNSWYNMLPVRDSAGGTMQKNFSASQLKANEIRWGNETLAKIPQMKGRISRKNVKSGDGDRVTRYVELILEKGYDREKRQSRNKRVTIGIDISHIFDGMMIINKNYHKYFDYEGNLVYPLDPDYIPEKRPKPDMPYTEEDNQQAIAEPARESDPKSDPDPEQQQEAEDTTEQAESVMTTDTNHPDDRNDEEIQAELNRKQHEKDHLDFLRSMLNRYQNTIQDQARKRPDKKLTAYQVRKINKVLKELKAFFDDTDISDYLELAEEPSDDNPDAGMTYTDMEILLHAYTNTLTEYTMGKLWLK